MRHAFHYIDTVYIALCSSLERESLGSRSSRKTSKEKKKPTGRGTKGSIFSIPVYLGGLLFLFQSFF